MNWHGQQCLTGTLKLHCSVEQSTRPTMCLVNGSTWPACCYVHSSTIALETRVLSASNEASQWKSLANLLVHVIVCLKPHQGVWMWELLGQPLGRSTILLGQRLAARVDLLQCCFIAGRQKVYANIPLLINLDSYTCSLVTCTLTRPASSPLSVF